MTGEQQVYGSSLYELAREEGLEEELMLQLEQVLSIFKQNPDYGKMLATVCIPKQERCQALDEAFRGQIHPYLLNFMKILCENGTIGQLPGCAGQFRHRYQEDHGILEVCAVTAVELRRDLQDKLQKKLEQILGKTVALTCRVDPACMGGVRLELPGRQLDGTVKSRLEAMSKSLQAAI